MNVPILLGEIVEKDGMLCLQTHPNCWYPLGGNSSIADRFREHFNEPAQSDIGRRVYSSGGQLYMESVEQAAERRNI